MNLVALKTDEQRRGVKGGWGKSGEREERGLVNGGETMREVEGRGLFLSSNHRVPKKLNFGEFIFFSDN